MLIKSVCLAICLITVPGHATAPPDRTCAAALARVRGLSAEQKQALTAANDGAFSISVLKKTIGGKTRTVVVVGELNRKSAEDETRLSRVAEQFGVRASEDREEDALLRPYWFKRTLKVLWPRLGVVMRTFFGPAHVEGKTVLDAPSLDQEAAQLADWMHQQSRAAIARGESTVRQEQEFILGLNSSAGRALDFRTRALLARIPLARLAQRLDEESPAQATAVDTTTSPSATKFEYISLADGFRPSLGAKLHAALWALGTRIPTSGPTTFLSYVIATSLAVVAVHSSSWATQYSGVGLGAGWAALVTAAQYGKLRGFAQAFLRDRGRSAYLTGRLNQNLLENVETDRAVVFVRILQVKEVVRLLRKRGFRVVAELPLDMAKLGIPDLNDLEYIRHFGANR